MVELINYFVPLKESSNGFLFKLNETEIRHAPSAALPLSAVPHANMGFYIRGMAV